MALPFLRFRKWLAELIRPRRDTFCDGLIHDLLWVNRAMVLVDFYGGGPKDGDCERVDPGVTEWPVVSAVPVVLSPWGEREESDLVRIVRLGAYVRTRQGFAWRPE